MPGISFLFWNVNRHPLEERVGRIISSEQIDVALLAEAMIPSATLVTRVEQLTGVRYRVADGTAGRFVVCSRLPRRALRLVLDTPRWRVYRVVVDQIPEFLLTVAHLPSKLHTDAHTQAVTVDELAADITRYETKRQHVRTALVGDLNMNPFEPEVSGVRGLHAVNSVAVAARDTREVRGQEFRMFYNPMWSLMGDRSPGPPGTFYRGAADAVNYFWNTYDQVLLRPELAPRLHRLEVLVTDGVESLLTRNGLPDATHASDHLPLLFRLEW
jgi:hypothetical protein